MKRSNFACLTLVAALGATALHAASLDISIGIRETGGSGPAFSDAGTANGIEFVNQDGQSLVADGTWQQFTFTPTVDTLTAFAGSTANSELDADWVALEMIRVRNSDGITLPIRLWVDEFANTTSSGTVTEGFESLTVGSEAMFQEPRFSGSTSSHIDENGPNTAAVTDTEAFSGDQSYQFDWQFVDDTPTRWARLTTFNVDPLGNPAFLARESNFNPTISFWAKAVVIPEPSSFLLCGFAGLGIIGFGRRKR